MLSQFNNSVKKGSTKEVFLASHAIGTYIYNIPVHIKWFKASAVVLFYDTVFGRFLLGHKGYWLLHSVLGAVHMK